MSLLDLDKSDYRTARLYDAFFGKYKTEAQYSKDDMCAYKDAVEKTLEYTFNTTLIPIKGHYRTTAVQLRFITSHVWYRA